MPELGVNIDHVATVREARKTNEPDPVWAATLAELGGADGITLHLREDRRHIQERDVRLVIQTVTLPINLELACSEEEIDFACQVLPQQATLVPERREEVTTEGGLDAVGQRARLETAVAKLRDAGISVSLFLDPDPKQLEAGLEVNPEGIEIHTGAYANATLRHDRRNTDQQLAILNKAGEIVTSGGVRLHAGHGLTYRNVRPVALLPNMCELNIGHSIIARSLMVGLPQAVRDMKSLLTTVN